MRLILAAVLALAVPAAAHAETCALTPRQVVTQFIREGGRVPFHRVLPAWINVEGALLHVATTQDWVSRARSETEETVRRRLSSLKARLNEFIECLRGPSGRQVSSGWLHAFAEARDRPAGAGKP